MKRFKIVGVSFFLFLQSIVAPAFSQCKKFIQQVDFSILDEYSTCGRAQRATMYSNDSAVVSLKLQSNTKYRILVDAQSYLGKVKLEVVNNSQELVSIPIEKEELRYWEVYSDQKEMVDLKISFSKSIMHQKSNHGINAAGCVVLAVGMIRLDELVDNSSAVSTDL